MLWNQYYKRWQCPCCLCLCSERKPYRRLNTEGHHELQTRNQH